MTDYIDVAQALVDAGYQKRPNFALADLFRVKWVRTHQVNLRTENVYLHLAGKHVITDDPLVRAKQQTAWAGGEGPAPHEGPLFTRRCPLNEERPRPSCAATGSTGGSLPRMLRHQPRMPSSLMRAR